MGGGCYLCDWRSNYVNLLNSMYRQVRKIGLFHKLGYAQIWCLSRLYPPPPEGRFPPVWVSPYKPHGLVAVGGSLTPETLLLAYSEGIYPFYVEHPIEWLSCNPRMVLFLERTKLEKKTRRIIRSGRFRVTFDTSYEEVIRACSDRAWTWLNPERIDVAVALHRLGRAHSVEVWNEVGDLVGGVVGVDMGRIFVSESCFHRESNAGKVADAYLYCHLQHWGYGLCDAQAYSPHLAELGFEEIPRREYIHRLHEWTDPEIQGRKWSVDERLDVAGWIPAAPGSQLNHPSPTR